MPRKTTKTTKRKAPARSGYYYGGSGAYTKRYMYGKGAYSYDNPGPWGKTGESVGAMIGGKYGGPIGSYALGKAGRYIGHKVGRLFGSGSYGITDGTTVMAPDPPKFVNDRSDDSVVITHREYLGDLYTSSTVGALKIQHYPLNPSATQTFPWLSNIAGPNYQQYKFDGLVFEFKSFSADALNSANTALGSVFACINYDSADADFTSRSQIENSDWSRSVKPSESMMIPVECAPRMTAGRGLLYVSNANNIPANTDIKTYLLGKLSVGTTGFQAANVNIGSLYVTYKIRLYKPLLTPPLAFSNIVQYVRSGAVNAAPLGSGFTPSGITCDTIGVLFGTSGTTFTLNKNRLQQGQIYILRCSWEGVSSASLSPPLASGITVSPIGSAEGVSGYLSQGTAFSEQPNAAVTDTICGFLFSFIIRDPTLDITFTLPTAGVALPGSNNLTFNLWQLCGVSPTSIGIYDGRS